ncbi:hypothetical protein ACFOHQ_07970 [Xanthomonas fragariae]
MSDMAMIRIGILISGLLLVAAIFLFGRPKKRRKGAGSTRTTERCASVASR